MYIIESTFEQILPVWKTQLWPNRQSAIEPHSAMKFLGGHDMIYFENNATFILAMDHEKIVGCLSGHRTEPLWYRSRGLWVDQSYRKNNVARTLVNKLFSVAKQEGCTWIWTVPRISSMQFYEKVGFIRASKDFDEGVEFGPNCYAARSLC
jgi:GNAT superfamily N-acetyltransferase